MSRNNGYLSKRRITNGVGKEQHIGRSFELQFERLTEDISSYHIRRYESNTDLKRRGVSWTLSSGSISVQGPSEDSNPIGRLPLPGRE